MSNFSDLSSIKGAGWTQEDTLHKIAANLGGVKSVQQIIVSIDAGIAIQDITISPISEKYRIIRNGVYSTANINIMMVTWQKINSTTIRVRRGNSAGSATLAATVEDLY